MNLSPLTLDQTSLIQQAAHLLHLGFQTLAPTAWPTVQAALEEIDDLLNIEDAFIRVALEGEQVLGFVGALPAYDSLTWELHPLVVHPQHQKRGLGRALVQDLEAQVRARGGENIFLGTDDEVGLTSLANCELYPDPWAHLATLQNLGGHPYSFYEKLGYRIVGLLPHANGWGKPDIFMAKRLV